jgi:hypothetical protein
MNCDSFYLIAKLASTRHKISLQTYRIYVTILIPYQTKFSCYLCCSVVVLFYVLVVCKCVLAPGDNPIAVNKCIISYQKGKMHPCTGTEALYRLYGP